MRKSETELWNEMSESVADEDELEEIEALFEFWFEV